MMVNSGHQWVSVMNNRGCNWMDCGDAIWESTNRQVENPPVNIPKKCGQLIICRWFFLGKPWLFHMFLYVYPRVSTSLMKDAKLHSTSDPDVGAEFTSWELYGVIVALLLFPLKFNVVVSKTLAASLVDDFFFCSYYPIIGSIDNTVDWHFYTMHCGKPN